MRIVIDGRMLYWTGVGRYTSALLEHLAMLDHETEYIVLTRPADRMLWEPRAGNFRRVEVDINPYTLAEQLRLPGVIAALKPDLVHFTAVNAPLFYRGRRVVTIHDLTLLDYDTSRGTGLKRWLRGLKRGPFRMIMSGNVRAATIVMTPTQYVKDEVTRRFGATENKVTTIYLAADQHLAEPQSLEKFGIGGPFVLFVGNAYPYKVGRLIEGFALLAKTHPQLKLVMTCKPDYFRGALEAEARELGVHDRLVLTGFVTDGEIVALYREAQAYVYPSFSEGFGLQMLEAMMQGLPVAAARASCLPEIGGEAAVYFDPHDPTDLARVVGGLLDDEHKRNELRAAGQARVKQFSWRRMAEETLAVYQKALKK